MHIHILGICGTFMGSLALLARELGYRVTGVDEKVYPPMSTQLLEAGIELCEGYDRHGLEGLKPDSVVIGNALSRGNPAVEYVLDNGLDYVSGPEWIARYVLKGRHVLAVAGTHGKTTTSSMLAWILESAGESPGYLIGGVPANFGHSARLGSGKYFVIEADEYDCAFFDKRSKFIHYQPKTLVINNLEFDHADIFDDLAQIQRQFQHLLRVVPSSGQVLLPYESSLQQVVEDGCWSNVSWLSGENSDWHVIEQKGDQSCFKVINHEYPDDIGDVHWELYGQHNLCNGLAAIAAAHAVGVSIADAASALNSFQSVKRRMELLVKIDDILVFDDFAHHPTAIRLTLEAARARFSGQRIIAVIEPRSNTMKMGVHNAELVDAIACADKVWWYQAGEVAKHSDLFERKVNVTIKQNIASIVEDVSAEALSGDVIIIMSNGGFGGIHKKMINTLSSKQG